MLKNNLVIVESPAKAKTIAKFLGKNFKVIASVGHVRDLPKSQLGVDIEHDFSPKYVTIRGKGDITKKLKAEAKKAEAVYLATDPDREGEAISWHIRYLLGLNEEDKIRVEFHEITENVVREAIKHPRKIDMSLVDAQQARRVLDRIVGYQISPLLWNKVQRGLSAGRVQSVALKIICDRELEIQNFVPEEYWTINVILSDGKMKYDAEFFGIYSDGKEEKMAIATREDAMKIISSLDNDHYEVISVKNGKKSKNPYPPFITSTLQQEASKKLGFSSKKTMQIAQTLYEGVNIGNGNHVGLITYMRTDSTRLSQEALNASERYVLEHFGEKYAKKNNFSTKGMKSSQDAHEAIRPTDAFRTPESLKTYLSSDQQKLYTMIWKRFIASQMSSAQYHTVSATINNNDRLFKISNSILFFNGYMAVYDYEEDTPVVQQIKLKSGDVLVQENILPKQHFTKPPARFTEASLIKYLEELRIGRPSTFAQIIGILLSRSYALMEQKSFVPTELGKKVNAILQEYFSSIVNEGFTADLESKLDEIAEGRIRWKDVVKDFYKDFSIDLSKADEEIERQKEEVIVTDEKCENCGKNLIVKNGRYGAFLACPAYPECQFTKPILKKIGVTCPQCGGDVVEKNTRGGKPFYGCSNYPVCDYVSWDEPSAEKCPICSSNMIVKRRKRGDFLQCTKCKHKITL